MFLGVVIFCVLFVLVRGKQKISRVASLGGRRHLHPTKKRYTKAFQPTRLFEVAVGQNESTNKPQVLVHVSFCQGSNSDTFFWPTAICHVLQNQKFPPQTPPHPLPDPPDPPDSQTPQTPPDPPDPPPHPRRPRPQADPR